MNACRAIANAVSWHDDNKSQVATVRGSIAALVAVLCEEGPLRFLCVWVCVCVCLCGSIAALVAVLCEEGPLRVLSFGLRLCEEGPLLRD